MGLQSFASSAQLEQATKGRIMASDPWVVEALFTASAAIRAYCGWHVAPVVSETVMLDGTGDTTISLPSLRVVSVEALSDGGTSLVIGNLNWSTRGTIDRASTVPYDGGPRHWSTLRRAVSVSYTHGHDFENVPELVHLTCTLAARALIDLRSAGVRREATGPNSVDYLEARILPFEEVLLRPYALPGGV